MLFAPTLLASTSLMHIGASLLIRVLLLSSPALVLTLKMVLPSVSIATFLRLLVLYSFLPSFHLTSELRLSLQLSSSLTGSPPLFFTGVHLMSAFLVMLPVTVISGVLGVFVLSFFLLVSALN